MVRDSDAGTVFSTASENCDVLIVFCKHDTIQ